MGRGARGCDPRARARARRTRRLHALVGARTIARFASRIVNVHPSLLPAFPGIDGPAQALAARVRVSGCSVHLVDQGIDSGPIIAQATVPVLPDDDEASLHQRIQRAEHGLLPAVIDAIARGTITLEPELRIASRASTKRRCSRHRS